MEQETASALACWLYNLMHMGRVLPARNCGALIGERTDTPGQAFPHNSEDVVQFVSTAQLHDVYTPVLDNGHHTIAFTHRSAGHVSRRVATPDAASVS